MGDLFRFRLESHVRERQHSRQRRLNVVARAGTQEGYNKIVTGSHRKIVSKEGQWRAIPEFQSQKAKRNRTDQPT